MSSFEYDLLVIFLIVFIVLLLGRGWFAVDQYVLRRTKTMIQLEADGGASAPGMDNKIELTTAAKYAIWQYIWSILGIGGAVIGVLSGITGYLIKDLGTE